MTEAKRTSTGYTPIDVEIVKAEQLSCGALGFLNHIRLHCDEEETDGVISALSLGALCVRYQVTRRQRETWLGELMAVRFVVQNEQSYVDVRFSQWCRSKTERDQQREAWREHKKRQRAQSDEPHQDQPGQMSTVDMGVESKQDSTLDSTRDSSVDSKRESNGVSTHVVAASAPASTSTSAPSSSEKAREAIVLDVFLGLGITKTRLAAKAATIRNIAGCQLPDELLVAELRRRASTFAQGDPPRSPDLFWPDLQIAENAWLKSQRGISVNGFKRLLTERPRDPDDSREPDPDDLPVTVRAT